MDRGVPAEPFQRSLDDPATTISPLCDSKTRDLD